MNYPLNLGRATEGLAVGEEFEALTWFYKGQVVGKLLERLLDQLDESRRSATVREWACIQQAIHFFAFGNYEDALERALDACKPSTQPDFPGGGQTQMLRAGLASAIDAHVSRQQA